MLTPIELTDVFTAAECDRIVAIAGADGFDAAGLVRGRRHDNIRRAGIHWLDDEAAGWVTDRLIAAVAEANRRHFDFALTEFAERAQVAVYEAAEGGHFDWHADIGDGPLAARRKLTIVVQLSDAGAYEGGALELNADGHVRTAPRERGAAILFPGFVLHRVTPVTRGRRHSLTTWIHGPDFR